MPRMSTRGDVAERRRIFVKELLKVGLIWHSDDCDEGGEQAGSLSRHSGDLSEHGARDGIILLGRLQRGPFTLLQTLNEVFEDLFKHAIGIHGIRKKGSRYQDTSSIN